ncbi:DUF2793 domain-containing protein [Croceicoccus ponticola]|uniref:DUF2793 domain-containing protein n=1 Tax=Croceicoccus ponticola TaxID=2217664 RepID=A0A437H287_9SPHN|nr:DUF2793 domain-containing protein [Croceicoccus ponticola]RVQ69700.1 DUF2793 domain-containing protein [Croceicoccus ponticola]
MPAAQAQKEFYVNEAHALTDALLHPVVLGSISAPPANAANGDCWIVGAAATGAFVGHENELASLQEGQWLYSVPGKGMTVYDIGLGKRRFFNGSWEIATEVNAPLAGSVIDLEARASILQIIEALRAAGVLANY